MNKSLLLSILSLALAGSINAQHVVYEYDDELDDRPTRESFVTNKWFDNIFLGAGIGGGTTFGKEITDNLFVPTFNINLLKWFSPTIGARLSFNQFFTKEGLDGYSPYQMGSGHSALPYKWKSTGTFKGAGVFEPGTLYYGHSNVNFSLLWNMSQFFKFYDPKRFYNASLYIDGGFSYLYDDQVGEGWKSKNYDREFSLGTGLYNTFRINDRWNATADLAFMGYSGGYRTDKGYVTFSPNLTIGISYNIYKTRWNDKKVYIEQINDYQAQAIEVKEENVILEKAVEEKDESINDLQDEIDELKKKLADANSQLDGMATRNYEYTVFFELDIHKMTASEKIRTKVYVKNVLRKDPDHIFYLTGSADKGTGSLDHNIQLASRRSVEVMNYLINELGVNENNVFINDPLVTDSQMGASYDRRVFFEGK